MSVYICSGKQCLLSSLKSVVGLQLRDWLPTEVKTAGVQY